jgi:hypothetical protein
MDGSGGARRAGFTWIARIAKKCRPAQFPLILDCSAGAGKGLDENRTREDWRAAEGAGM